MLTNDLLFVKRPNILHDRFNACTVSQPITGFSTQTGHDKRAPPEEPRRDVLVTSVYWDWGGTSFSTRNKHSQRSPVGAIHESPLQHRRDLLVRSALARSIIHSISPGTTSVPFRIIFRRDLLVTSVCWDWGGTSFSTRNKHSQRSPVGAIHESPLQHRRDLLVRSALARSIIHSISPSTTSVPLRKNLGGTCLSRPCVGTGEERLSLHGTSTLSVHR